MSTIKTLLTPDHHEQQHAERMIKYTSFCEDSGHLLVSRVRHDGTNETIGHVYTENNGDEYRYVSTNQAGREIFPDAANFCAIDIGFEKYARLLALQEKESINEINNNSHIKI